MDTTLGFTNKTAITLIATPPPLHLKHKPVYMLPYSEFDGPYAGDTDCKYLSIGHAQWPDDPDALSVKTFRWTESAQKWSRQSEEIPITRCVDLVIFMVKTIISSNNEVPEFPVNTFENQDEVIRLKKINDMPLHCDGAIELVKKRLSELKRVLNEIEI